MARYLGGDFDEITASHPLLGDFRFQPKANESYELDPGGFRNNDDDSAVTGGGVAITQKNRVRWSFSGPFATDFQSGNEMDNLPALAASPEMAVFTFSHISGVIWKGKGEIVGDIKPDSNTALTTIKISGDGKLEKL